MPPITSHNQSCTVAGNPGLQAALAELVQECTARHPSLVEQLCTLADGLSQAAGGWLWAGWTSDVLQSILNMKLRSCCEGPRIELYALPMR